MYLLSKTMLSVVGHIHVAVSHGRERATIKNPMHSHRKLAAINLFLQIINRF
jgi:nicotinamide mononucleotide adenylyltransferase